MLNRFILLIIFSIIPLLFCGCSSSLQQTSVTGLCGSCKPYYVRGSMHYPQTHYEYDEEGLASWYGPGFHGKPKPMGEKFNQHAMTAAHKTLPLPTIAKVTNLDNGKSVVVLIDDRGPFVYKGRIIDLSMEAAKQLGSYQKGTARVRVQSLVEESKALSDYLAKYGHHMRKDRLKRTWLQIYEQEIKKSVHVGGANFESALSTPPLHEPSFNAAHNMQKNKHRHKAKAQMIKEKPIKNSPKAPPSKASQAASSKQRYILLDESFSKKSDAVQKLKKLNKQYPGQLAQTLNANGKSIWKIRLGPLAKGLDPSSILKQ